MVQYSLIYHKSKSTGFASSFDHSQDYNIESSFKQPYCSAPAVHFLFTKLLFLVLTIFYRSITSHHLPHKP